LQRNAGEPDGLRVVDLISRNAFAFGCCPLTVANAMRLIPSYSNWIKSTARLRHPLHSVTICSESVQILIALSTQIFWIPVFALGGGVMIVSNKWLQDR